MSGTKVENSPLGTNVAINHQRENVDTPDGVISLPRLVPVVNVPPNMLVNTCPLNRGILVKAQACPACTFFGGWWQRGVNGVFDKDFAVFCTFGVPRSLTSFKE